MSRRKILALLILWLFQMLNWIKPAPEGWAVIVAAICIVIALPDHKL